MTETKKIINQPFLVQLMKHSLEHKDVLNIKLKIILDFSVYSEKRGYWLNNSVRVNGTI